MMSKQKPIRGTLFGGFNKKDVAAYIEELSANSNKYKDENEKLRECRGSKEALDALQREHDVLTAELEQLKADNARLEDENATLTSELKALKSDIEAYKAAREQLVSLELDANRRAVEIERGARTNADKTLREAGEYVTELQASLDTICRDALRMKENLRAQICGLESSIDDLTTLSRSKHEFLGKYLHHDN